MRSKPAPEIIEARIYGLLKYVHGAVEGERNARVFWAACIIREMVRNREVDDATGDQAFEELRQMGVHIGLPDWEVIRTIKSAAYGRNSGGRAA